MRHLDCSNFSIAGHRKIRRSEESASAHCDTAACSGGRGRRRVLIALCLFHYFHPFFSPFPSFASPFPGAKSHLSIEQRVGKLPRIGRKMGFHRLISRRDAITYDKFVVNLCKQSNHESRFSFIYFFVDFLQIAVVVADHELFSIPLWFHRLIWKRQHMNFLSAMTKWFRQCQF